MDKEKALLFALDELQRAHTDPTFRRIIGSFSSSIASAQEAIEKAAPTTDKHDAEQCEALQLWKEGVIDEECDLIESIIGAAFVVCQTKVSEIIQIAKTARSTLRSIDPQCQLDEITKNKALEIGSKAGTSSVSKIRALWECANYFKHRDEWVCSKWENLSYDMQKKTASVCKQIGLSPGSTGNLRRGAEIVGSKEHYDLSEFTRVISEWSSELNASIVKHLPEHIKISP